ncbi:MAG: class I SAM-dependent methyltransferase [Acidimicrobiaceae bacterium]|nr:class I SAM-dependent methyltransferase [Acidimicrobiaceae bacterium]
MEAFKPRSVVDVGCGLGGWLAAFGRYGVEDLMGIDGKYMRDRRLKIPAHQFEALDLSQPFHLTRTFDLALCSEVAEHLPPERAEDLVAELCRLAPVCCFSAAIPGQGGTHHINEQWQDYWAKLFAKQGRCTLDLIRAKVWQDPGVEPYYAQNMLQFTASVHARTPGDLPLRLVHPTLFASVARSTYDSKSWRYTAPLRTAGQFARRIAARRLTAMR